MAKLKLLSESALRKKYPSSGRADMYLPTEKTLWLPSSCIALNWQTGGGLQYGKVHELFGYESTGKTLLAMDFARSAQKLGGVVLWDDAEKSWNTQWAIQNGLDPSKVEIYDSNDVEGFSDWARDMILMYRSKLIRNEPIFIVCDSIAALDCKDNLESDQVNSKAEMGNRAKAIYKMYRLRIDFWARYGATILMINQVRDKVGASMFEASTTTPGGAATKFFASIRIGLVASKQIKGVVVKGKFREDATKGNKIGRNVYIRIEKNKLAPPKGSVKTQVYFLPHAYGYTGYSKYGALREILEEEKIITSKAGRFYYKEKLIAYGEDAFMEAIHNKPKMRALLIKKAGINTITRFKERVDAIKENMFPVKTKVEASEG